MDVDTLIRVQTNMDDEFKKYLSIDEFNLDVEWRNYSSLFMEVCEKQLQATQDWLMVKNLLEREQAKYYVDIKDNPKNYTINNRITESFIDGMVTLQPRMQKLKQELSEKQYIKDRYACLVKAMEGKRKAMENIVNLIALQYCDPKANNHKAMEEGKRKSISAAKLIKESFNQESDNEDAE